jgi:hypothetical protein
MNQSTARRSSHPLYSGYALRMVFANWPSLPRRARFSARKIAQILSKLRRKLNGVKKIEADLFSELL